MVTVVKNTLTEITYKNWLDPTTIPKRDKFCSYNHVL